AEAWYCAQGGIDVRATAGAMFSSPPALGNIAPNSGAFTTLNATSIASLHGNVNVTAFAVDGATLYSTGGFGFPATHSRFFTSGIDAPSLRYISNYYAQTAIYATTT